MATRNDSLPSFNALRAEGALEISIVTGISPQRITVEAEDEKDLGTVQTRVENGTLAVIHKANKSSGTKRFWGIPFFNITTPRPIRIQIECEALNSVVLKGAHHLALKSPASTAQFFFTLEGASHAAIEVCAENMDLRLAGANHLTATLTAKNLKTFIDGTNRVELIGAAENHELHMQGVSSLNALRFISHKTAANVKGLCRTQFGERNS